MVPPGSKFDAMREAAIHAAHVTALVSALYVMHLLAMRGLVPHGSPCDSGAHVVLPSRPAGDLR